jgi:hypothetical protein
MISRKTTKAIAEAFERCFSYSKHVSGRYGSRSRLHAFVSADELYDFLFVNDYSPWFCNLAKTLSGGGKRSVLEMVMRLHTGETVAQSTPEWTWEKRQQLGERYLKDLAEDIVIHWQNETDQNLKDRYKDQIDVVVKSLELDGFIFRDGQLLVPEAEVVNTREEHGVLQTLYLSLGLENQAVASHHLELSEEHYTSGKWDDSISNSRKFLECVLSEIVASHSLRTKGVRPSTSLLERPSEVRDYLENENLLETKEKEALAKVYSLLSHTGSHPYMAQNDQARLLRHLSLTFTQFAMLRFEGLLKGGLKER